MHINIKNSQYFAHTLYLSVLYDFDNKYFLLSNIYWLVCLMDTDYALCVEGSEFLYVI